MKIQDFENWLNRGCKSPAETALKTQLDDTGAAPTMQQLLMRHADIRTTMGYGKRRRVTLEMRQATSKVARMAIN